MNGILIIDKPKGWTSHDVVQKTRRLLGEKSVGHTGTLDPLATGVLVLCVGKATRIARYLESDDKEYIAELRLGITTDTLDSDGSVLEAKAYEPIPIEVVQEVLDRFKGSITQRPPVYSAVKVNGVPSHRLARKGESVRLRERQVTIHALTLLEYADPLIRFAVTCSKGTYVRSLCADIGAALGPGAHLTALTRTRAGLFGMHQAISLDRLSAAAANRLVAPLVLSLNDALARFPETIVESCDASRISHGNPVPDRRSRADGSPVDHVRIVDHDGNLIAVGRTVDGFLKPEVVFV